MGMNYKSMRTQYKGLNYIFADYIFKSLGLSLSAMYVFLNIPALVFIGNIFMFIGSIYMLFGIGMFVRVRVQRYPYVALTVFFSTLYAYFTFVYPSTRTRLLIFTVLSIPVLLNGLRVIFVLADEKHKEYAKNAGGVIGALLLINIFRIYNGFHHFQPMNYDTLIGIETLAILSSAIMLLMLTFTLSQMIHKKLMNQMFEVQKQSQDLLESSRRNESIDPLSKTMNRKKIEELLIVLMDQYKVYHDTFTLMLIDIDHFKRFNTAFGNQTGDQVLIEVASTLQENLRKNDVVGRWGDEEFIVLMHATPQAFAVSVGEMLIEKVRERHIVSDHIPERITISVGCSEIKPGLSLKQLLVNVDEALQIAKSQGRNQIRVFDEQSV